MEFAREYAPIKGNAEEHIPDNIEGGKTVQILNPLLKGDWWKTNLAEKAIKEMETDDIDEEIKTKLTKIYDSIY